MKTLWAAAAILTTLGATALAAVAADQAVGDPRSVVVEEIRNDRPAFMVRIDVDHADRVYHGGEEMHVGVTSEQAGYLYLIYCDAGRKLNCLFPNRLDQDNRIPSGRMVQIPPLGALFRLRVSPPFGQEVLKAIVTLAPLSREQLGEILSGGNERGLKSLRESVKDLTDGWAEHHVLTTTVPPGDSAAPTPNPTPDDSGRPSTSTRRIGVFVGVSEYQDPSIPRLSTAHLDAIHLADAFTKYCGLDHADVLVNARATRAAIEQILRQRLPAMARPGNTVVIFWSGHGGRCADTHGRSRDGYQEYLVPYDGQTGDPAAVERSMLLDDTFGRWMQELDGRRIVVILDACYSGGQGESKSLSKGLDLPASAPPRVRFNFLDRALRQAKKLGQTDLAMLASSTADQVSFERREKDMGVMTYFLVRQLATPGAPLTLAAVHAELVRRVPKYVESRFPGATQTPVLIDQIAPPFYLRP